MDIKSVSVKDSKSDTVFLLDSQVCMHVTVIR